MAIIKDADALLLGRRTYVTHAEAFEPMKRASGRGASIEIREMAGS